MPGSPDPSLWQTLADSRFVQTLVTALGMAAAVGYAVARFLKSARPETRADEDLKARIETGVWEQVAHELRGIREDVQDVRERVATIEGVLSRNKNGG